jgi:hypothetical protein
VGERRRRTENHYRANTTGRPADIVAAFGSIISVVVRDTRGSSINLPMDREPIIARDSFEPRRHAGFSNRECSERFT